MKKLLQKNLTKHNIEIALYRASLYEFVKAAWDTIEPGVEYVDNWHIQLICAALELAYKGRIKNLAINIPPRFMKSTLVSVCFPAWVLANNPTKQFLCVSYAETLATRDALKCRNLIESKWYTDRFIDVKLVDDQNQKGYYKTTANGCRISLGVAGGVTGEGGDFILVDDAIKADDANSDARRGAVNFWYDNTLKSRLNDPMTGVKIIIGQRLHDDDLFGHILRSNEVWTHIILPFEYEGERYHSVYSKLNDPRSVMGDLLWHDRLDTADINTLKANKLIYANQYQQRGSPLEGNIYKKEWFINRNAYTEYVGRYISWDTASSINDTAAYTSGIVGELLPDYRLFIRDVFRARLEFPQLKSAIENLARKYKANLKAIVIENKSSGIQAVQSLAQSTEMWISGLLVPFNPEKDKVARAKAASIWCENGSVILPPANGNFPWLFEFEEEVFQFPNSHYMDQVDSFNQLILFLANYLADGFHTRMKQK